MKFFPEDYRDWLDIKTERIRYSSDTETDSEDGYI